MQNVYWYSSHAQTLLSCFSFSFLLFVVIAREQVGTKSTQGMLLREHISTQDMLGREQVSMQGMLAHEHVSMQGTLARKHASHVGT